MLRVRTVTTGVPGAPYYTNLYFGGDTQGEADVAAAAVVTFWSNLSGNIRSDATMTIEQDVAQVDALTGDITALFSTDGGTVVGAENSPRQPTVLQGLIRLRTGDYVAGREIRGRVFVPGSNDNDDTDGVPSTVYITQANLSANELLDDAAPAGGWIVYSPTHHEFGLINSATTWNQWAVLRSRR